MKKIKHSKFKNTGILFELLVRQITVEILNGTDEVAKGIIKEFFKAGTELSKEKKLYDLLLKEKYNTESRAEKFIDVVLEAHSKIKPNQILKEKYNLIKKIQESFDINEFLNSPLTSYKTYASIYKIFESKNVENFDIKDNLNARFTLVEHIINDSIKNKNKLVEDRAIQQYQKQEKDVRLLSYKILVETFNKKYTTLNASQKGLLKEYINNINNTSKFKDYYNNKLKGIVTSLHEQYTKTQDKVTKIKLKETINVLRKQKVRKKVTDSQVSALMLGYELMKELKHVRK
tara:strand:+ start:13446 stop:14312 length:867 start_codon:yes stop_codon:yes gene_type:complete